MLTDLVLSPAALATTPAELARLVTTVVQQAAAQARSTVRETFEPLRTSGVVHGTPVLFPEPGPATQPPAPTRRRAVEDESFEERSIVRRRVGP